MNELMIEKYNSILKLFENTIIKTNNEGLKNSAKESYLVFINDLALVEKKEIRFYLEKLNSLNIDSVFIREISEKRNLQLFKSIEDDKLENKETKDDSKNKSKESSTENIKKDTTAKDKLGLYIINNVHNSTNKELVNSYNKLVFKLQDDLKNPNESLVKTWINNYVAFVEKYNELDKEKMYEYTNYLFEEYDKDKNYINKVSHYLEEARKNVSEVKLEKDNREEKDNKEDKIEDSKKEKGFKILNIKKPTLSYKTKKILMGATALVGVGAGVSAFGVGAVPIAYIIYKLYKSKGLTNLRLKMFLKRNGYSINEDTKELVDSNGEVVTEEKVGKAKYEMCKQYLLKINTSSKKGEIKTEYKKNKIASMLLNSKYVIKFRDKFTKTKESSEELLNSENEEMLKGMGKC